MKIIAEIGSNWLINDELNQLAYISLLVKQLDFVDYIKFQFWDTDKFVQPNHPSYDKVKKFQVPESLYKPIFDLIGPERFMVTCFDTETADKMKEIGCINWKIASGDITYESLITHIAKFKDPMWISTGNADNYEITRAAYIAGKINNEITMMHCVSKYPTKANEVGIMYIDRLKRQFPYFKVGLSTHTTIPAVNKACGMAIALGADCVEVHVKLDNKMQSMDSPFSLTVEDLKFLKKDIDTYESMCYNIEQDENEKIWARRNENGLRPNKEL